MTEKEQTLSSSSDLKQPGFLKIGSVEIDTKIKVGAILWLEDKYGQPVEKINFQTGRVREYANLIIALALQRNSELSEKDIEKSISQVDTDELRKFNEEVYKLFDVQVKNLAGPVETELIENK